MKTMLKKIKMPKNQISEHTWPIFEEIVENYTKNDCEERFMMAMEEHLTKQQIYCLVKQCGSCKGTANDTLRKDFAKEYAYLPIKERFELFTSVFNKQAVLNNDHTITITFSCNHGYYKHTPTNTFPFSNCLEIYFQRCAGGRIYEYEKALGICLEIQSVDISSLVENPLNPVTFILKIVN